jgi:hypothetical protein
MAQKIYFVTFVTGVTFKSANYVNQFFTLYVALILVTTCHVCHFVTGFVAEEEEHHAC